MRAEEPVNTQSAHLKIERRMKHPRARSFVRVAAVHLQPPRDVLILCTGNVYSGEPITAVLPNMLKSH